VPRFQYWLQWAICCIWTNIKKNKNKKYSETTKMPLKVKKIIKISLKGLFMSFPKGFFDINLTN
jgi:hypothetical protein